MTMSLMADETTKNSSMKINLWTSVASRLFLFFRCGGNQFSTDVCQIMCAEQNVYV